MLVMHYLTVTNMIYDFIFIFIIIIIDALPDVN